MYERFSDRARKAMQLANYQAQRFHHEYIGTEHILLGLLKEGSGVACNVLKNLVVDGEKLCLEVYKLMTPGPETGTLGKLPQTPRAKKVIEYSIEEARNLNHNYVGTEHLLLGLLREQEGLAAQVLASCGIKLKSVRQEIRSILGMSAQKASAYVIVTGDPFQGGLKVYGDEANDVWPSEEAAQTELDKVYEGGDYWIVPVRRFPPKPE